jgi:hypothetical protein
VRDYGHGSAEAEAPSSEALRKCLRSVMPRSIDGEK